MLPLVMGVVNVTPDSFSDGGHFINPAAAVEHGLDLMAEGADMLDVGAESTRPGFEPVTSAEQCRRLEHVLPALKNVGVPFSVDTRSAEVAEFAADAGAFMINDVSGGRHDPAMLGLVAESDVDFVCQLWRRDQATGGDRAGRLQIRDQMAQRLDACLAAGIALDRIVLDPGLGFGPDTEDDWAILAHIEDITSLGYRVLVGASRKRFLAEPGDEPIAREGAGIAVTAWCAQHGVWAVRTHTVAAHRRAIAVISRLQAVASGE